MRITAAKRARAAAMGGMVVLLWLISPRDVRPGPAPGGGGPPPEGPQCDVVFSPTQGPGALRAVLAREMRRARDALDIALYSGMTADLAREVVAASRDCRVRVLADEGALVADPEDADAGAPRWREILSRAGVAVRIMKIPHHEDERPVFHHKFAVIDGRTVLTGSYNWSARGDGLNYENMVLIRDRELAGRFAQEFQRLWAKAVLPK